MTETYNFNGYDIPINLMEMTGGGADTFAVISRWHIDLIQKHIGIKQSDSIVEIGCGIGRDAIPLTEILDENGSYLGTDVIYQSIEWCSVNISRKNPNFRFVWHNIYDDLHNPTGTLRAIDVRLPVDDLSVDLVVLQSVFTHMFEGEIIHYLQEFRRILKPTGRVWASVFIVNDEVIKRVNETAPTQYELAFKHPFGQGCYINSLDSKRGAVAFDRYAIDRMLRLSQMDHVKPPLDGTWSGVHPNPEFGQDVLILKKDNLRE